MNDMHDMTGLPEIDGARLWSDLMTMGAIGGTARGGSFRPALSGADAEARNLFAHWAREAGLALSVDRVGNMFARREGRDPSLPPLMIGSHLDTQMPGGKFDGVLGVLAGLAVVRALNAAGLETQRAIEIVNWTNEEGARFQPGLMGSAVFAGLLPLDEVLARTDRKGLSVRDELAATGYAGPVPAGGREVHKYLELHIEQGPELEKNGAVIGAVTNSSWGCSGFIEIRGENGHSQTAAMSRRRNALVGAAKLILAIEEIGAAQEPAGMVSATVVENWPNNRVNIPHLAKLSYVVVHETAEGRQAIIDRIEEAARRIAEDSHLDIETTTAHFRDRLDFSPDLLDLTVKTAEGRGLSVMTLPTLTAHDALSIHFVAPVAIVFVPCRDGISHSELEWCEPEHATAGARVLLDMALAAANEG
ncbi:hydantoinase/carbamoylase family amidase [Rhizobiaceae bacterium BDR2-2]|uniref:Hydantoinase/carbamoylase family amidase n=1 Tax=Ectorhizobium quercum TaxID=2965071 RepID=A0AAE3SVT9_9HYPH|nr:hydantoinase/carbamoylase family amidase [Ectorhizobium quercum]MCX8998018.1 hydantoinase/carbamoylase family amidase [Ectorhizobium quercum]